MRVDPPEIKRAIRTVAESTDQRERDCAFAEVAAYIRSTLNIVAFRYRTYGERDDLRQVMLLRAFKACKNFDAEGAGDVAGFFYRVGMRACESAVRDATRLKRAGRSLERAQTYDGRSVAELLSDPYPHNPSEHRDELRFVLATVHRLLSHREWEMLRGFAVEGLTYQELAERHGVPIKSVDNAINRARQKLAKWRSMKECTATP